MAPTLATRPPARVPTRRGTTWNVTSQPLEIGRCESCRQPDRGLYEAAPLDDEGEPLGIRPFQICIDCLPL